MINARRKRFCGAASTCEAHVSCEDAGSNNTREATRFPIQMMTDILVSQTPDLRLRPPRAEDDGSRISVELTLGHHGSRRVLTHWSFADGVLAHGVLANWRVLSNRLRTRDVRSNSGSHQGQRGSPNDHDFQHFQVSCCQRWTQLDPMLVTSTINSLPYQPPHELFSNECCGNGTTFGRWELVFFGELSQQCLLQKIEGKIRPVRLIYAR